MFNTDLITDAITITLEGMLGIFAFMLIFYLSIVLIDKIFPKKIEK